MSKIITISIINEKNIVDPKVQLFSLMISESKAPVTVLNVSTVFRKDISKQWVKMHTINNIENGEDDHKRH